LEYSLFTELRDRISGQIPRLQNLAEKVAEIDVYQCLAAVSAEHRFVKPVLSDGYDLRLEGGRHPVVEAVLKESAFIANGSTLSKEDGNILLITGPNMAGKSTYMRQVALICIMAQIGCFVPASSAEVPLIDRIFTRIGAADDLIGGQSTFMVEMADIQVMTEKATARSLIIIDELGRGTSTSEGMAIAQAVIEYVHDTISCKALVSTHFHELAHLEESLKGLKNYSMAVQESGDKVNFLRKLVPGAADSSYGIYCARLAGLPEGIIDRAYGLLQSIEQAAYPGGSSIHYGGGLESQAAAKEVATTSIQQPENVIAETSGILADSYSSIADEVVQLSIFGEEEPRKNRKGSANHAAVVTEVQENPAIKEFITSVRNADLMNMTPLQAMSLLNDLKMKAKDL
jgi:DNA mismatch repair protein MutS